jgi:hypothetical protein
MTLSLKVKQQKNQGSLTLTISAIRNGILVKGGGEPVFFVSAEEAFSAIREAGVSAFTEYGNSQSDAASAAVVANRKKRKAKEEDDP